MSPVALEAVVLVAVAAAVLALLLLLLLLPQAASTNAPKLAAPALPAIFRNRLRSTSSRTSRSTIPAGWRRSRRPVNWASWVPPVDDLFGRHRDGLPCAAQLSARMLCR